MNDAPVSEPPLSPDQQAAHEFLVELNTRIATRRLPYQHGVEARALGNLGELFASARDAMKRHPGCLNFCDTVTRVLNLEVRPITAKWHRAAENGLLNSRDGCDEFRADLEALRSKLCTLANELRLMAYGPAAGPSPCSPDQKDDFETAVAVDVERCLQVLDFGVVRRERPADSRLNERIGDINASEAEEIRRRRERHGLPTPAGKDAVGLALSGGGIRSATFCLGIVQVLAERNLLRDVDFLSTVSGGGYVGSFITSRIGGLPDPDRASNFREIAKPTAPTPTPSPFCASTQNISRPSI